MKVNFGTSNEVEIRTLKVGDVFIAERTHAHEKELYMKVDKNSGLCLLRSLEFECIAVNLESGQLRKFNFNALVQPIEAEVNLNLK